MSRYFIIICVIALSLCGCQKEPPINCPICGTWIVKNSDFSSEFWIIGKDGTFTIRYQENSTSKYKTEIGSYRFISSTKPMQLYINSNVPSLGIIEFVNSDTIQVEVGDVMPKKFTSQALILNRVKN